MHFHNDPSDNIDDFLPNWDAINTDFDEASYVKTVEAARRTEYAALAEL